MDPSKVDQEGDTDALRDKEVNEEHYLFENLLDSDFEDDDLLGSEDDTKQKAADHSLRLVLAIDYGKSFTSVAFALARGKAALAKPREICVIQNWTRKMANQNRVPSVISYSEPRVGHAQWGSDIDEASFIMINTKAELELQDTRLGELESTMNFLAGAGGLSFAHLKKVGPEPPYTWRSPTQILADYLTRIFQSVRENIERDISGRSAVDVRVDIVITVPPKWSYEAKNSLFKAVRQAGFSKEGVSTFGELFTIGDEIILSEPEAAAMLTVRDLQDEEPEVLEKDQNFILCDAGDGTVDVCSFQVKQANQPLVLQQITLGTSGRCGSSNINSAFKYWLRDMIGMQNYSRLDPGGARQQIMSFRYETGAMRELMHRFEKQKQMFSNSSLDNIKLDLWSSSYPDLDDLTIANRVNEGELNIYRDEMKAFFDGCVNEIIDLIDQEYRSFVEQKQRRPRNVFLVGGFGQSPYLQESLRDSLKLRNMQLRRTKDFLEPASVAIGAVIYGIPNSHTRVAALIELNRSQEKVYHQVTYMSAVTIDYGVLIGRKFQWLIRAGDLVLSRGGASVQSKSFSYVKSRAARSNSECLVPIYLYRKINPEDVPPMNWEEGADEVECAALVQCDFSRFLENDNGAIGGLRWRFRLYGPKLQARLLSREIILGDCNIELEIDRTTTGG